jgi:hypothetical protein
MRSNVRRQESEIFDELVYNFIQSADESLLQDILLAGMNIVKSVRLYYRDLYLTESFDKDMVLEFLFKFLGDRDGITPTRALRNVSYEKVKLYIEMANTPHIETYDAHVYSVDVTSRLVFEESLTSVLADLPLRIQASILYLIYFPEKTSLLKFVHFSLLDYFLTLQGISKVKNMVDNITTDDSASFHFRLPETQIARLLMVSSLYKVSPAVLVLLMQEKNLNSLIQFCTLFGGQSVSVPTVAELKSTIQQSSELAGRLEEGHLSIGDQEALAYLASDLDKVEEFNQDIPLNPVLSSFFEKILQITLKNYDNYQKRLIEGVDRENPDDILRIYEIMNHELRTQIQLVMEISSSVEGREEVNRIIDLLTQNYN